VDFNKAKPFLPNDLDGKIGAMIVRDGCTLKIFDEEDYISEEEPLEITGIVEVGFLSPYVLFITFSKR